MRRTRSTSNNAALLAAAVLLTACGPAAPAAPSPTRAATEIQTMLDASAASWTAGDLDGFLDDYAQDATFVGSSGLLEGRDRIRRSYLSGYWESGTPAQGLRFQLLDVRTVGTDAAVAVGRYELFDRTTDVASASGLFSLTLHRTADGWKIVHDHSSADPSG